MIKLNAQGEQAPTMRTVQKTGEPVSFVDKLSALAQKAISRLAGGSYAGGSFSRITKMIPAVMLAVFAFSTASAQNLYTTDFEYLNSGATNVNPGTAPSGTTWNSLFSTTPSWSASSGSFSRVDRQPGGGTNYVLSLDQNENYILTLTVPTGYRMTVNSVALTKSASAGGFADIDVDITNGSSTYEWGNYTGTQSSVTATPDAGEQIQNVTGTVTITIDVSDNGVGGFDSWIDDITVAGTLECIPFANITVGTIPAFCTGSTTTVPVSGLESGVTYQLYNGVTPVGSAYANTTASGTHSFATVAAGTYTVRGTRTGVTACFGTVGNASVTATPTPTVPTITNAGDVCAGGTSVISVTNGATGVQYTLRSSTAPTSVLQTINYPTVAFAPVAAGSYVVRARLIASPNCESANSSATTISTISAPTASFGTPAANDTTQCIGDIPVWYLTGSPNATVTYQIGTNPQQTVTLSGSNGSVQYAASTGEGALTMTLISVAVNGCVTTLNPQPTQTIYTRQALNATIAGGTNTSVCSGDAFSDVTISLPYSGNTATLHNRRVRWTRTSTGTSATASTTGILNFNGSSTSQTLSPATGGFSGSLHNTTHTIRIDSVWYASDTGCVRRYTTTPPSVTLTTKARPTFNFTMNGMNMNAYTSNALATSGSGDTICVPATGGVSFAIANAPQGSTYTVLYNNTPFGTSGSVNNNGAGLVANVNGDPSGIYSVTVSDVSGNNCPTTLYYKVVTVSRPSFTYSINNVTITEGATVNMCVGQSFNDVLVSTGNVRFEITSNQQTASPFNVGNTILNAGNNYTFNSSNTATTAGTYVVTVTANNNNYSSTCATTLSFNVVVTALPSFTVSYNGNTVSNGSEQNTCEDMNASIVITGTPGHLVEIHYDYGTTLVQNFNQLQTGVIGMNGTYTWNNANGIMGNNYQAATDVTTSCGDLSRMMYEIEVKDPNTLCAAPIFEFASKVNQKPSIRVGYAYTNNITTTLPSSGNGAAINAAGATAGSVDTVKLCYVNGTSQIKYYFDWNTAGNVAYFNDGGSSSCRGPQNVVTFELYKQGTVGAIFSGSLTSTSVNSTTTIPVVAGSEGMYTLVVRNSAYNGGCDSVRSFYVQANAAPVYTIVHNGTSTIPGATATSATTGNNASATNQITFCQNYATGVTITGTAGMTQAYTLNRIGTGNGTAQNFSGTLTSTGITHVFNQLAPGTHHYLLTVTSTPGACPAYRSFRVVVTEAPQPQLFAVLNGDTTQVVNGTTYSYCQDDEVHYIVKTPSAYSNTFQYQMTKTGVGNLVAVGTTLVNAIETSVVTLDMQAGITGTYNFRLRTNSSTSTCDSNMSFNVVVNNRPVLTYINHDNMLNCFGDATGWVSYSYNGVGAGTSFTTYIIKNTTDTVQTHNSNLSTQASVTHSNLTAGDYTLVLVSNNGCPSSFDFSISQPATPVLVNVTDTTSACAPNTGAVVFDVSGGTAGYTVEIRNVVTNALATTFTQGSAFTNYNVTTLTPGTYRIWVTDANGCTGVDTFVIVSCTQADMVPVISLNSFNYSVSANATSGLPVTIQVVNVGQLATTQGAHRINVILPTNFTISNSGLPSGWTSSYIAPFTVLQNTNTQILPGFANALTINGTIMLSGTTSNGVKPMLVTIPAGNAGDTNSNNNSTATVINVID